MDSPSWIGSAAGELRSQKVQIESGVPGDHDVQIYRRRSLRAGECT